MSSFLFALYFPATGFRKLPPVFFFSSWRAYSNLQNQARMKMWLKYRNFSNEILLLHYKLLIEHFWNYFLMCSSFLRKISIRDTAILRVCLASYARFLTTALLKYSQYNGFLSPIPESIPMKTLHWIKLQNYLIEKYNLRLCLRYFYGTTEVLHSYIEQTPGKYSHVTITSCILAMLCLHHLHCI